MKVRTKNKAKRKKRSKKEIARDNAEKEKSGIMSIYLDIFVPLV
jgi:hypothetical protein